MAALSGCTLLENSSGKSSIAGTENVKTHNVVLCHFFSYNPRAKETVACLTIP